LKIYHEFIEYYNKMIKMCVQKYWNITENIEFQPASKIDQLVKTNKHNYTVLSSDVRVEQYKTGQSINHMSLYVFTLYLSEDAEDRYEEYLDKETTTNGNKYTKRGSYIMRVSLPSYYLSEVDYKFVIGQFNSCIDYSLKNEVKVSLFKPYNYITRDKVLYDKAKVSTLLIPEEWTDSDLNKEKIGQIYHYPYEIKPFSSIDSIILTPKNNLLYIYKAYSDKTGVLMYYLVDNDSDKIIAEVTAEGFTFALGGFIDAEKGSKMAVSFRNTVSLNYTHFIGMNGFIAKSGEYGFGDYRNDLKEYEKSHK
jgi:hypothetical protein